MISESSDIEAPGADAQRGASLRRTLFLDMTDLLEYAKHNGTLSGIQRVVSSLLTYAEDWERGQSEYDTVPVVPEYDRFRVLAVDLAPVVAMVRLIEEHQGGRGRIDAAIETIYESRFEVFPRRGDLFVIAGAFWIYPHYDLIMRLRERGVVFSLFVHDLIQIKNPEYVHKDATLVFRRSLVDALNIANFVLTNSHYVAGEVEGFVAGKLDFTLPVAAVPLATELRSQPMREDARLPKDVTEILRRDYVLCVGTIEVRKNHLLLVKIWERLAREIGDALPDLVFVGKWGWDIAPLRAHLDETNFLGGRVRVVTNASDAALVQLYRHCLMTAYVSFAEGFGLPVGESLAYGKPCVASRATSLPEVGGEFAKYIDPNDADEGVDLFKSLFTDRGRVERWADDIEARYAPKTWRAFTFEFLDACGRMAKQIGPAPFPNNCLLPAGSVSALGNSAINQIEDDGRPLSSFRMSRDAHWHPLEDWGCWSSEREASLAFRTNLPAGAPALVALRLQATPDSRNAAVTVEVNGGRPRRFALYRLAAWYVAAGEVAEGGVLRVQFRCDGEFGQPDTRSLYLGLVALEIQPDGAAARHALMRRSLLSRSVAATRRAAARIAGGRRISGRQSSDLRRIARETLDARLSEGDAQARLRVFGSGGERRGALAIVLPAPGVLTTPAPLYMSAANCLARDFYAADFVAFCRDLGQPAELHRRLWEYAFIAHHLQTAGALAPGRKGFAATVEDDPLISYFRARGCDVDGPSEAEGRYDFLWSVNTAFIGAPAERTASVLALLQSRLKPGGVAVLTGDLGLSAYERRAGVDSETCVTRAEVEGLAAALSALGHRLLPLPFEFGMTSLDALVDTPPYGSGVHMKIMQGRTVVASFGLVIVVADVAARSPTAK